MGPLGRALGRANDRDFFTSDEASQLLSRRSFCFGVFALAASSIWVDATARASGRIRLREEQQQATRLTATDLNVLVDRATADLRQRLRGRADLDLLAESVSFEGAQALSALTLTDEPGAVRITPRAITDDPSRQAVEMTIAVPELTLWTMGGGRNDPHYPPAAFAVVPHPLDTQGQRSGSVTLGSTTGRSSSSVLPLFLVTNQSATRGYWFAVGWSGSWEVTARKDGDRHHLRFEFPVGGRRGQNGGEIMMGTFAGDGWAAIKEYLSAISRDVGPPRVVANTWYAHNEDIDEGTLLADIPVAATAGVEVYTIDAGWYSKPGLKFGSDGLGTWRVDQTKFPHGLEPVMEAIRAQGMQPGLWFEPERAWKGSTLWKEQPSWLLRDGQTDEALVDFGNSEVQRWASELLITAIEQYGLEWIKWDFNIDPAPLWKGNAARESAHILGVYAVMEEVRRRHPEVSLEMCASGGNRIDSEMIRRADAYWISDQTTKTDGQRLQSASAAAVLPARYRYTAMAQSSVHGTPKDGNVFSEESWLTPMSGTFGIMEPFAQWPASLRDQAARAVARFKEIRHLLDGTVTVFRDDPATPNRGWEAWEFSDPASGHAALFAFRQRSPNEHHSFRARHYWDVHLPKRGAALPRKHGRRRDVSSSPHEARLPNRRGRADGAPLA
jgi:alpha-galactosidase